MYSCEIGASEPVYVRWFSLNKTSGQLELTSALSLTTVRSVDLVIKASDDCWSGYWELPTARRDVTWSPRDDSLLLVRVTVVVATRFVMTSLYAGVVTQAQAGHDVIKLTVLYLLHFDICLCLFSQLRNDLTKSLSQRCVYLSIRLSVCLSVCLFLSFCLSHWYIVSKRLFSLFLKRFALCERTKNCLNNTQRRAVSVQRLCSLIA